MKVAIDPGGEDFSYVELAQIHTEDVASGDDGSVTIEPGALILGITQEHVELPIASRLAARVEGRSTL